MMDHTSQEATVHRLLRKRAEEKGTPHDLTDVEKLRLENISLKRTILKQDMDALDGEFQATIRDIRKRLEIPESYDVGVSTDYSQIVSVPPEPKEGKENGQPG